MTHSRFITQNDKRSLQILSEMENTTQSFEQLMLNVVDSGDIKNLLKLLNFGISSNIRDSNGDPLLFIPIVNGNIEMLDALLTSGMYHSPYIAISCENTDLKASFNSS